MRGAPGRPRGPRLTVRLQFFLASSLLVGALFLGLTLRALIFRQEDAAVALSGPVQFFPATIAGLSGVVLPVGVSIAAYVWALACLRRGFARSLTAALVMSAVAAAAVLPGAPLSSPDAAHFAADVRTLWLHAEYPAREAGVPANFDDPVAEKVLVYRAEPSGYGPLAYVLGGLALPLVGDGFKANVFGVKLVAGLFLVASAAATAWLAWRLGGNAALAAGAIGLHPLLLWEFPLGGHNDTIMVAFAVSGLALALGSSLLSRVGGAAAALAAVLTKFSVVVVAPLLLSWWLPRLRWLMAAGMALAPLALLVFLAKTHVSTGGPARALSFPTLWGALADALGSTDYLPEAFYLLFGLAAAGIVAFHPLRTRLDLARAAALTLFLFVYGLPGYHPWYQIWYLPFVVVVPGGRLWDAAMVFSLGAFVPLFGLHWRGPLEEQLLVPDPTHTFAVLLWGGVLVMLMAPWRGWRAAR